MAEIISEVLKKKLFWITPPTEKLLEKITGLEEDIGRYEPSKLNDKQKQIRGICEDYIKTARELVKGTLSHPHLVWNLLHRVDEHLILLMPEKELAARVVDVEVGFDLNIKEEKVRKEWLGEQGKLTVAMSDIDKGKNIEKSRYLVKEALQYLDDVVDYGFWKLSMNVLISVLSASVLAGLMIYQFYQTDLWQYAMLGLLGGYLGTLLTKEDFLFVWGGPFLRYFFYNLLARPLIGAFTAVFFMLVERSKLIFSINSIVDNRPPVPVTSAAININVNSDIVSYVYIVLAIVVGFGGEKILRGMMDKVLKRLEEKAEKTKESGSETKKSDKKD